MSEHTFGRDPPIHPVTKMPLERGHGALDDRLQAYRIHLPSLPEPARAVMQKALDDFYNPPPQQEIKKVVKKAAKTVEKIAKDIEHE